MNSQDHLRSFTEQLRLAPTDAKCEKIVRYTIEEMVKDCPMHILSRLGQCLIDCRKSELRAEAERN